MNRRFQLIISSLLLVISCACGGDDDNKDEPTASTITLSPTSISAPCDAYDTSISVTCSADWMTYTNDSWITVKQNGSTSVNVSIAANTAYTERSGKVYVKSGTKSEEVTVTQEATPKPDPTIEPESSVPDGYELVWSDSFNEGSVPNTNYWWYETGASGWGNNEIQNYVGCTTPTGEKMAYIEDGKLNIKCAKINGTVYSIRMNTNQSWTYGWFEARLKLPTGKGTWPAFWMMPKNYNAWPDDGEIDIMEEVGVDANWVSSSIHCKAYYHSIGTQKTASKYLATAQSDFHVYALEWTEDVIRTYVDGEQLFEFENDGTGNYNTWPFYNPFYLKLNLAWGGDWGGYAGVDESCLPAIYQIDYVRVFQKK